MAKKRLSLILFWILVLHLILSVAFMFNPHFLRSRLSVFYRVYVMPGPFFTDSQIIDPYSVNVSWKVKGKWSLPVSPSFESFKKFHSDFNPTDLYRSRVVQGLYPRSSGVDSSGLKKEFNSGPLKQFLFDRYVPEDADSVRIWFMNKKAAGFVVKTDSVLVSISR